MEQFAAPEGHDAVVDAAVAAAVEGTVQDGVVRSVEGDEVVVGFGEGLEGVVPLRDFGPASPVTTPDAGATAATVSSSPAIGQAVAVYVEHALPSSRRFLLSKDKGERMRQLERVMKAHADGTVIEGEIVAAIDGGFAVDVGVRAFLPSSQFGLRPVRDLKQVLGQRFLFKVIRVDERRHNIVLSRRVLLEAERDKSLERIQTGAIVEGVVKNFVDYGAFVEVLGIDGLLHVTDMSYGKVNHPSDLVKIGQRVTLKVLKYDPASQRLSLGLRQAQEDPWVGAEKKYAVGARVQGLVVSKTDYGCFLELEPGVEGLVHVTGPMIPAGTREAVRRAEIGEDLEAVVLDVDLAKKRISLTLPVA
ncbi:MAG: S1 RNA-binding domain-containing protein [Deltaproteobacteria bacterium]|nr:S1 RNA-binding domain-containing protein [Deltaproteobacteria bacterium]